MTALLESLALTVTPDVASVFILSIFHFSQVGKSILNRHYDNAALSTIKILWKGELIGCNTLTQ